MTASAPAGDGPSPWLDAALVAVSALVLALVAIGGAAAVGTAVVGAALAVLAAVWFLLGRRSLDGGPHWALVLAALIAACAAGAAVTPAFATFQVIAFPLAWLLTPGLRASIVANVLVALAVGVGYAFGTSVVEALAVGGISLAFSLALGLWITRLSDRSASRQALVEELTAAQDRIAALGRDAGAALERERLARDLHDTLTQTLTGIVMLAERAKASNPGDATLPVLEDAARQALDEVRALVTDGAPVSLAQGLPAAVAALAARFHRETGLQVDAAVRADVPRGLEVVLLRCAQEGLANVRKHSGADRVRLEIVQDGGDAVLTVADDGRGPGDGQGFGIAGMRDRLALVGGALELASSPAGGGAVLTVRVPVQAVVGAP